MLLVRVFRSFTMYALPPQGRETLDKFVFINWISEKSIIKKKLVKLTLPKLPFWQLA